MPDARSSFLISLTLVLCACTAGRPSGDAPTDAGSADDRSTAMDGHALDASMMDSPGSELGVIDLGVPTDAALDAAAVSHPPAGFTLCGEGTFTGAEELAACMSVPGISGALPYPVDCSGASCTGGRYEIWCPPMDGTFVYFWVELTGVQAPAMSCIVTFGDASGPLSLYTELAGGRYVGSTGPRGSDGDFMGTGVFLDRGPMNVVFEGQASFGGSVGMTGTLNLWISATVAECPGSTTHPPPHYVLGVPMVWGTADV